MFISVNLCPDEGTFCIVYNQTEGNRTITRWPPHLARMFYYIMVLQSTNTQYSTVYVLKRLLQYYKTRQDKGRNFFSISFKFISTTEPSLNIFTETRPKVHHIPTFPHRTIHLTLHSYIDK